jgi:hypothetical protein
VRRQEYDRLKAHYQQLKVRAADGEMEESDFDFVFSSDEEAETESEDSE